MLTEHRFLEGNLYTTLPPMLFVNNLQLINLFMFDTRIESMPSDIFTPSYYPFNYRCMHHPHHIHSLTHARSCGPSLDGASCSRLYCVCLSLVLTRRSRHVLCHMRPVSPVLQPH